MRLWICLFLLAAALGQNSTTAKVYTFDKGNTEHCRVVRANGKPFLESTFDGTSVAVGLPVNRGNGRFSVFVAISRLDAGAIQVSPKEFYGIFSDAAHTRFTYYDESGDMQGPMADAWMSAASGQIDPGSLRPGAVLGGPGGGGGSPGSGLPGDSPSDSKRAGSGLAMRATYFHGGKVKQGAKSFGWITLRPIKGAKLDVQPADMLGEVDIVINDTRFRF